MLKSLLAFRGKPQLLIWAILPLVLLLNVWVDFRHPAWLIIDGLVILGAAIALLKNWFASRS